MRFVLPGPLTFFGFRRMVSTFLWDSWERSGFPGTSTNYYWLACDCYVVLLCRCYDRASYVRYYIQYDMICI